MPDPRLADIQKKKIKEATKNLEKIERKISKYIPKQEVVEYSTTGRWESSSSIVKSE